MRSTSPLQGVAILVAFLLTATVLVSAPPARAAASAPSWTVGDHWTYAQSSGTPPVAGNSLEIRVVGRDSIDLAGGAREGFHATWTSSGVVTREEWIQVADLGLVKLVLPLSGHQTTTYDPPVVQARFPLSPGQTWSGTSNTVTGSGTGRLTFSGTVESELDVSVPAGTFHAFAIRIPSAGSIATPYSKYYYSDAVGYFVKVERYDMADEKLSEMALTAFGYQSGAAGMYLIIGAVVAIVVVAVIAVLLWKRKHAAGKTRGAGVRLPVAPSPPYGPPAYPSQQPPQTPPQGRP